MTCPRCGCVLFAGRCLVCRPRLLDLYCGQGGAGMGYHQAGFDVKGVDLKRQTRYPFEFFCADAVEYVRRYGALFDLIHASPPCQFGTDCQRIQGNEHPNLIPATREALVRTGKPYVIENVPGAKDHLIDPVMLCGAMFPGIEVYRHRYFESNVTLKAPEHPPHVHPQVKMGRAPKPGEWVQAVGNFSGVQQAREAMSVPWMNRDGIRECIPPAYTEWIGRQVREHIAGVTEAAA
jgi:DNA (cytosine-5)-methyltransferase 1